MSQFQYDVFAIDMFPDGVGGWVENERQKIGLLHIECNGDVTPESIIAILRDFTYTDFLGAEHHVLTTTDRRRIYAEDYYGDGSWWEVGTRKGHKPFLGLSLVEPH